MGENCKCEVEKIKKSGNAGFSLSEITNQKKLFFDVRNGPGIRIEPTKRFKDSFFRDNYYDTLVLTERIIEENHKFITEVGFAESSQYRLYNIISFLGGRGTGKTSVMDSAVLALRDQFKREEYIDFAEKYRKRFGWNQEDCTSKNDPFECIKRAEFICLDEIDASLLEKNENIIDVVLAKMLQLFQKETAISGKTFWSINNRAYRREDIYAAFEEIYHNWHNLLRRSFGVSSSFDANLEVMRELAGSLHIREKLTDLVQYYIRAIAEDLPDIKSDDVYMLIRIDDLDLNPDCYEMLEQIHRYLMIPRIIIYFSASPEELRDVCQKHYVEHYSRAKELATDYLDKVLTTSRRIYMPTLINENVFIEPDNGDVKKTILWKIGRRTRVFFDGCGYKKHFYEESNLRALLNLYYEFDSMEQLNLQGELLKNPKDQALYMLSFERNIDKLYDDVTKRLAMEKLDNSEQNAFFREYCREDSARRGRFFYEWLEENYRRTSEKSNDTGVYRNVDALSSHTKNEYNYGELMRSINHFGREYKSLKPLIHCVLAEYTVTMTKLFYRMRFSGDATKKARYTSKFIECISGSVIGSWAFKLLPQVQRSSMMDVTMIGYEEAFRLGGTISLERYMKKSTIGTSYEQSKRLLEDENINFVRTIELLGMFFTKIQKSMGVSRRLLILEGGNNNSPDKNLSTAVASFLENKKPMRLILNERTCTFDILGFVLVGINAKTYFEKVEDCLMEMFTTYWIDNRETVLKNKIDDFRKLIRKHSMREEYDNWVDKYGGLALPVYSLDIMYNITKRVKIEMESRRIGEDYQEDLIDSLNDCYGLYLKNLQDETVYYSKLKENNPKSCNIELDKTLSECPFYKHFTTDIKRNDGNNILRAMFKEVLWGDIGRSSPVDDIGGMEEMFLTGDMEYPSPSND